VVLPDEAPAPFGVAPPLLPVGALEAPDVPPPEVPPPDVPPPDVPPLDEPDDEPAVPDDADDDEDGDEPEDEVDVVPVVLVVVEPVVAGAAEMVAVGTVSGGVPEVSVAAEPLPHAATAADTAAPAASALTMREPRRAAERRGTSLPSDLEWVHPPAAMRTIVEVLLAVLVAPVAEAEVLDGPRQLGGRRREGQELTYDLERLPGLPVNIGPPGVGFDHDLTTAGWRPETVPLTRPHPWPSYSRGRMPAATRARHRGPDAGGPAFARGPDAATPPRRRATQPPSLPADGLDRVPPLKVWPNRWDASPR
jgi:hypothetical protein